MKFLDTCSILLLANNPIDEKIIISSITLNELENIKTSFNKDGDIKYQARKVLHMLDNGKIDYELVVFEEKMIKPIMRTDFSITDDSKILACAIWYKNHINKDIEFVTNDLALKNIAKSFFSKVSSIKEDNKDEYCGYKEVQVSDEQLCELYSDTTINYFDLLVNEYVILKDKNNNFVDVRKWTGFENKDLKTKSFYSEYLGEIKPFKGDIYQKIACDSLVNNQLTVLRGPAGTGKTLLGLGYLFSKLEDGKIDKIIIFCNTVATKGSAKLGYYPGSRNEKILDSQIGNLLASKLGDIIAVEKLIAENKLLLLPTSDIRGFDTSGMNCGIMIDEAQNSTIELMKLMLQRIGEDSICVICGDDFTQVDMTDYEGGNNGLKRVCEIFKGEPYFGTSYLKNCHRSKIAKRAELM